MFCTACGTKAVPADRFCGRCGRPMREIRDIVPPQAKPPSQSVQSAPGLEVAPRSARIINLVFDYIGVWTFVFFLLLLVAFILGLTGRYDAASWENSLQGAPSYLLSLFLFFSYYLIFETIFGRTPGKILTGTRVVGLDGAKPKFTAILKRTALRLVPLDAFTFFGSPTPKGWHDAASRTVVIKGR